MNKEKNGIMSVILKKAMFILNFITETIHDITANKESYNTNINAVDINDKNSIKYYKHSEAYDIKLLWAIPIITIVAMLLALIHAYLTVYIPIIGITSIILTAGYTLAIGFTIYMMLNLFKTRNIKIAILFSVGAAIWAYYILWVAFIFVLCQKVSSNDSLLHIFLSPFEVLDWISAISKEGWMTIRGKLKIKGFFLWVVWFIEATIIILGSALFAIFLHNDSVFCEKCKQWNNDLNNMLSFFCSNLEELKQKIISQDISFLTTIKELEEKTPLYYRINCTICPNCNDFITLSLIEVKRVWVKEKEEEEEKEEESTQAIISNLIISKEFFETLKNYKNEKLTHIN